MEVDRERKGVATSGSVIRNGLDGTHGRELALSVS